MIRLLKMTMLLLMMSVALPARGDVIIQVESKSISAGSTSAFVDVWITGVSGDTLEVFDYEFLISGAIAQSGDLQFAEVQSDSEVFDNSATPYVFFGDSGAFAAARNGLNPVELTGGDILASEQDRSVNETFLLARLELVHTGIMSLPSHQFTISLVPGGTFFDRDADDPGFQPLDFTHTPGIITVNAATAAVPEPGTLGLLCIATGTAIGRRLRRRKIVEHAIGMNQDGKQS